jgi:hypothetical protein
MKGKKKEERNFISVGFFSGENTHRETSDSSFLREGDFFFYFRIRQWGQNHHQPARRKKIFRKIKWGSAEEIGVRDLAREGGERKPGYSQVCDGKLDRKGDGRKRREEAGWRAN